MKNSINPGEIRPLYLLSEKGKPSTTRFSKALGVSDDTLLRSLSQRFLCGLDLHFTEDEDIFMSDDSKGNNKMK